MKKAEQIRLLREEIGRYLIEHDRELYARGEPYREAARRFWGERRDAMTARGVEVVPTGARVAAVARGLRSKGELEYDGSFRFSRRRLLDSTQWGRLRRELEYARDRLSACISVREVCRRYATWCSPEAVQEVLLTMRVRIGHAGNTSEGGR